MPYIRMTAKVKGAVTIAGAQIVGNHVEPAAYISGSAVRGALASLWEKPKQKTETFLDQFCRGDIRFHGLFPMPSAEDGKDFLKEQAFPCRMPLSAFACKYNPGTGTDEHGYVDAAGQVQMNKICGICKAPLKQCKTLDFYWYDSSIMRAVEQKKEIYLNHGTERKTRRAKDAALYSYSSICDGEQFIGWLSGGADALDKFRQDLSLAILPQKTKPDKDSELVLRLYFGRGKKRRGYLEVTMDPVSDNGSSFLPTPYLGNNLLVVVLQTPAIMLDELFCPKFTIDTKDIFGNLEKDCKITKVKDREFSAMTIVEGWSGVHKLPRMPEQAISPGSTFVFQMDSSCSDDGNDLLKRFKTIQAKGVGERLNEGYGQFLINPPTISTGG